MKYIACFLAIAVVLAIGGHEAKATRATGERAIVKAAHKVHGFWRCLTGSHQWRPQDAIKIKNHEYVETYCKGCGAHIHVMPDLMDPAHVEVIEVAGVLKGDALELFRLRAADMDWR